MIFCSFLTVFPNLTTFGEQWQVPAVNGLNPRCFKQFNPKLYGDYYANKKAWTVNGILQDFNKSLDRRMVRENRKILLLMDNAPSHIIPENVKNVRCEFLPATTTSHLQPIDAGIINAILYDSTLMQLMLVMHQRLKSVMQFAGQNWAGMKWQAAPF